MSKGKDTCYFHRALIHYAIDNFIVEKIDDAQSLKELNKKEKYWIEKYHANNPEYGYNLTIGGDGGATVHHIWINNGKENKYLSKDLLIPEGWSKGRINSDNFRYYSLNKVWINNGKENKLIKKEDLNNYLNDTWHKGMVDRGSIWRENIGKTKKNISEETKTKQSIARKIWYENHPNYIGKSTWKKGQQSHSKGKISVTNGIRNKYIFESELNAFLENNIDWKHGSTQHHKNRGETIDGKK